MAHIVTSKLNQPAREFSFGNDGGIGFSFQVSERYYDREAKESKYTNYDATVFANKNADYLRSVLVAGAIVQVSAKSASLRSYQAKTGETKWGIQLNDCSLDYASAGNSEQQSSPQQPYQPAPAPQYQQPTQQFAPQPQQQFYQQPPAQQFAPPPPQFAQPAPQQQFAHQPAGGYNPAGQVSQTTVVPAYDDYDQEVPF